MPETVDVVAKQLHVLTGFTATEVKQLKMAMNMCEGGPGETPEEKEAWEYFIGKFYPYIDQLDKDLAQHGA